MLRHVHFSNLNCIVAIKIVENEVKVALIYKCENFMKD